MWLRHRAQGFQLGREEGLVDLALVDGYAFLDAHPNHFLPVDAELLRKLIGRQVIRHRSASSVSRQRKSPLGASLLRSGGLGRRSLVVRGNQWARVPRVAMVLEGYVARMTSATSLERRAAGSVRYRVGGAGDPLLLVHGLGGSGENWVEVLPALLERFRVVVVDLPGHAGSPSLPAGATVGDFARALAVVLEHEGVDTAVV